MAYKIFKKMPGGNYTRYGIGFDTYDSLDDAMRFVYSLWGATNLSLRSSTVNDVYSLPFVDLGVWDTSRLEWHTQSTRPCSEQCASYNDEQVGRCMTAAFRNPGGYDQLNVFCNAGMTLLNNRSAQYGATEGSAMPISASETCRNCGTEITEQTAHTLDGGSNFDYCQSCYEEIGVECECCGAMAHPDLMVETQDCLMVCPSCVATRYHVCYGCDELVHRNHAYNFYGDRYCESCHHERFVGCDSCGETIWREDSYSSGDGCAYCESCWERDHQAINSYHSTDKTAYVFGVTDSNNRIGVEIEVDDTRYAIGNCELNELAQSVKDMMPDNLIVCEGDGSLSNGFEIITRPATKDYIDSIESEFEEMFSMLSRAGMRSHNTDTCGLHVHVGLDNLGDFATEIDYNLTKLLLLHEVHWDSILRLSRRTERNARNWADRYGFTDMKRLGDTVKLAKHQLARYRAVNMIPRDTVEFRLFRGTLNKDTFYATIDLVMALVAIAKECSLKDINTLEFRELIKPFASERLERYMDARLGSDDDDEGGDE